jgi:hypothetical protein
MNWRAPGLATVSFAISFAAWGLIGGEAPISPKPHASAKRMIATAQVA